MLSQNKLKTVTSMVQQVVKNVRFSSFDDTQRTPLTGEEAEDKEDIIEYLNSNIDKQGVQILQAYTNINITDMTLARIDDIFEEGVLIRYIVQSSPDSKAAQVRSTQKIARQNKQIVLELKSNTDSQTVFVPFRTCKGRPVERLYLLAAEAQIKQGIFDDVVAMILPTAKDKNSFTVMDTKFVSENMIRIYIKSEVALPQDDPGYAYRFELTRIDNGAENNTKKYINLTNLPIQLWQQIQPSVKNLPHATKIIDKTKEYGLLTALEVYKRLPEPQKKHKAQPIATTVERRYYTLRQHKSNTNEFRGEVDVYIHDDTPGSVWAKSLRAGDKIKVDTHYHETIKQMTVGQPLFICDETSMPTVAAMLERWQIDTVPIVISITNDKADCAYFDDLTLTESLKNKLQIQHIKTSEVENLADAVIELIKAQNKQIDCAWGAIGKADFRPIKQYLRDEHGLKGKLNRVRAYWV